MIYSVSDTIEDEIKNWNMPLYDIYKRLMFKKFDSWVQEKYMKAKEKNG